MKITNEEYILLLKLKQHQIVSISFEGDEMIINSATPPENYKPCQTITPIKDAILNKEHISYISLYRGHTYIYKPQLVTIIMQDIKFIEMNSKGTPIVEIEGQRLNGYGQISIHLFGYYRKDIKELLKPHFVINPALLKVVGHKTIRGNTFPVFTYGDSHKQINGIKNLKKLFPNLTYTQVNQLVPQLPAVSLRHETLIQKYNMAYVAGQYELTNDNNMIYYISQKKVIEQLKQWGETISRETAKKMFAALKETKQ